MAAHSSVSPAALRHQRAQPAHTWAPPAPLCSHSSGHCSWQAPAKQLWGSPLQSICFLHVEQFKNCRFVSVRFFHRFFSFQFSREISDPLYRTSQSTWHTQLQLWEWGGDRCHTVQASKMPSEPTTAQTKQVSDISVKPNLLLHFSSTDFLSNYLQPFVLPLRHVLSCAHSSTDAGKCRIHSRVTNISLNIFMGKCISSL